jgi:hypothetical protein
VRLLRDVHHCFAELSDVGFMAVQHRKSPLSDSAVSPILLPSRGSRSTYQHSHPPGKGTSSEPPEKPLGGVFRRSSTASHLVWGRVVPDIPDFCRGLVAALAEE